MHKSLHRVDGIAPPKISIRSGVSSGTSSDLPWVNSLLHAGSGEAGKANHKTLEGNGFNVICILFHGFLFWLSSFSITSILLLILKP